MDSIKVQGSHLLLLSAALGGTGGEGRLGDGAERARPFQPCILLPLYGKKKKKKGREKARKRAGRSHVNMTAADSAGGSAPPPPHAGPDRRDGELGEEAWERRRRLRDGEMRKKGRVTQ